MTTIVTFVIVSFLNRKRYITILKAVLIKYLTVNGNGLNKYFELNLDIFLIKIA